jgi:hypothetical protein
VTWDARRSIESFRLDAMRAFEMLEPWPIATRRESWVSGQRTKATSQSASTRARQAEGRAIRPRELFRVKDCTHQAGPVVKGRAEKHMTDFVGEHTAERTRHLTIVNYRDERSTGRRLHVKAVSRSLRGTCVGPVELNTVWPPQDFGLVLEVAQDDPGRNRTIDLEVDADVEGLGFVRLDSSHAPREQGGKEGRERLRALPGRTGSSLSTKVQTR